MNIWIVKCAESWSDGWHWIEYFHYYKKSKSLEFGGEQWIRSSSSKKYIRENVTIGDIVVSYQTNGREILGFTRMASDGLQHPRKSGNYNQFMLIPPAQAFNMTDTPLKISDLRSLGCNPKSFGPGTQGTVFPLETFEFDGIISAVKHFYPHLRHSLEKWLTDSAYSVKVAQSNNLKTSNRQVGAGFGNPEQNRKVEQTAIKIVKDLLEHNGWQIRSVESEQRGFDLIGTKGRKEINIEVKGISGSYENFMITTGEIYQAQNNPNFWIYMVTDTLTKEPRYYACKGNDFLKDFKIEPILFKADPLIELH